MDDLEELAGIIEQLDRTEFTYFSYEKGELRLVVRRGGHEPDAPATTPQAAAAQQSTQAKPAQAAPTASAPAPVSAEVPEGAEVVTAPMLGTFYAAPKPGEPAFVAVGQHVEADDTVCIIEVMKLMNSISAGVTGEIVAVLVRDGELVEQGHPLFAVRPTP